MRRVGSLLCAVAVAAALILVVTPPASSSGIVTTDTVLREQLAAASPTTRLLVYGRSTDISTAVDAFERSGITLVDRFDRIGVAVGAATPAAIARITALNVDVALGGDPGLRWFLDSSHESTRVPLADATFSGVDGPFDGTGVSIAVIDGGVDGNHPMFVRDGVSKVVRNLEMACTAPLNCTFPTFGDNLWIDSPVNDTDDVAGHGTHVAGIAAGYPVEVDGVTYQGAAPDAKIVGLSVATAGSVYYGALAAQYWVLQHHAAPCGADASPVECPPIKTVNNSYGPMCSVSDCTFTETTQVAMQRALVAEGVTMVWAAGNDGGSGSDDLVNPPAKDPTPGVIGVASYYDGDTGTRDGVVSSFSSRGLTTDSTTWPDLSAPGENIVSACQLHQSDCLLGMESPGYSSLSGTSMAAPHVAGYIARLLEADPTLSPEAVELALENTAYRFAAGAPYGTDARNPATPSSYDKGHGLVDVAAALASVLGATPPPGGDGGGGGACSATAPQINDLADDATGLLLNSTPLPSDPKSDILTGRIAYDGVAKTLTFSVRVADLRASDEAPNLGLGETFDFDFVHGGKPFYIRVSHQYPNPPVFALRMAAGAQAGATDTTVTDSGVTGTWDAGEASTWSATLPANVFTTRALGVPNFGYGSTIGTEGLGISSYRIHGALLTGVDQATGSCAYTAVAPTSDPDPDPTPTKPGKGVGRGKNPNK
ncbi:MAG TPA: S8 family serine peptidase [Acidimicrobiales bacterium]|nr:S8 family serine peptidase [Acidimicrobiales bacterium]